MGRPKTWPQRIAAGSPPHRPVDFSRLSASRVAPLSLSHSRVSSLASRLASRPASRRTPERSPERPPVRPQTVPGTAPAPTAFPPLGGERTGRIPVRAELTGWIPVWAELTGGDLANDVPEETTRANPKSWISRDGVGPSRGFHEMGGGGLWSRLGAVPAVNWLWGCSRARAVVTPG
jgi:hypothetical protein